jgi:hypothetical protein
LNVSVVFHASTFVIDTMTEWPGVMFIHLAIFPPFIAALVHAVRASRHTEGKDPRNLDPKFHMAPRWLVILTVVFFIYALVNFGIFAFFLTGGGKTFERDGKHFLIRGGAIVRELNDAEYRRHQAYVVRGFSGHWMMFASASLTMLVGAAKLRRVAARHDSKFMPASGQGT